MLPHFFACTQERRQAEEEITGDGGADRKKKHMLAEASEAYYKRYRDDAWALHSDEMGQAASDEAGGRAEVSHLNSRALVAQLRTTLARSALS